MVYRKDQCLGCGRPETRRPGNLQTKWNDIGDSGGIIEKDGTFVSPCFTTHFWFCSEECYEKVLDTFIKNREYSLKYNDENRPPGFQKKIDNLSRQFTATYVASDESESEAIEQRYKDDYHSLFKEWNDNRGSAIRWARLELCHRLDDEYWQQHCDEHEKWMEDLDKEDVAHEKELARILKEGERKDEKRLRDEERARREQERLDEKREREEEKRRKEEEKRAAEEAEEEKWRPRWFKL